MIYCSSLNCFTCFSTGYIIQTHSFPALFTSCIVAKSKPVYILILLFYICPLEVHRDTPIPSILQFFHEHRIQVFYILHVFIFYIVS